RAFGTFPKFIHQWCFENTLLSLPEAIRKITSLPADSARLKDRGRLTEGAYADVCIFDPTVLSGKASFENPFQYPQGMDLVIVNGQIVINEGAHTHARPGRFLTRDGD